MGKESEASKVLDQISILAPDFTIADQPYVFLSFVVSFYKYLSRTGCFNTFI
jgi:hypothetical protein